MTMVEREGAICGTPHTQCVIPTNIRCQSPVKLQVTTVSTPLYFAHEIRRTSVFCLPEPTQTESSGEAVARRCLRQTELFSTLL